MKRRTGFAAIAITLSLTSVTGTISAVGAPPSPDSSPAESAFRAPARQAAGLVTRRDYRNPTSRTFADTFADPALIRAKDGWWYSYGTSDPLREGEETVHRIPIARSRDMVRWTYVGDAFTNATLPSWATADAGIWAPDIRYVNGQYRLYYVVTQTTVGPAANVNDNAIGMATAPTPAGPWTDSGAPIVGPRPGASGNADDFLWTFDPHVVTNTDGSQWLFYGSYYGGMFVQRLTADGRRRVGNPTMVAIDNKFEGAYAIRRGNFWYLFASTANCCAGPTTGYSVHVGRSRSITGPYRDAQGVSLNQSRAGGTPTLVQNGNRWIGAGHNAVATDLAGQDWIVYHALNRRDPYLTGTDGVNERPMLMDRLDWVRGWPLVRGGRGPSESRQRGPASGGRWATTFTRGIPAGWRVAGSWPARTDPQSGAFRRSAERGRIVTRSGVGDSARVEADLRSTGAAYGLRAELGRNRTVQVLLDPQTGRFRLQSQRGNRVFTTASRLPSRFRARAWHAVSLEVRDGMATAMVSHARLGDPIAMARLRVGGGHVGSAGAVARGAGVGVDNLSVLPAADPVRRVVRERVPNRLDRAASDEFNGQYSAAGWTWVRRDNAATVGGGVLRWPTQAADLTGTSNNAGLLLRSPGTGRWTVETKVNIDLGTDTIRNFSQAGLIAYVNDDLFTRFSHVAIWNTRQTEFGKEMPYAGRLSYGGTIVGPPADTTWLRLTHRLDPNNGEHELRAWSSRDGRRWVKGGVWTLPARAQIRVGLVSHGGAGATAQFDYFRLYRS